MTHDMPEHGRNAAETDRPDEFIRRVSAELRSPEKVSDGFEQRVMGAVRQADPGVAAIRGERSAAWWRSPSIRLSPVHALALAAGIAAVAFVGGGLQDRSATDAAPAMAAGRTSDTVHVVRFVFVDADARRVTIAGSFNGWATESLPLRRSAATGVWTVSVPLPPGSHEYAFIVDGQRWAADPGALSITDEFGTATSIVTVGADDRST